MRREDCVELFSKIPEHYHAQVNLILRGQGMITVDCVVRFEEHYIVLRGREQGSTDEGRAFFVPYEELAYFRIERVLKLSELKRMYGETGYEDTEDKLGQQLAKDLVEEGDDEELAGVDSQTPPPSAPQDPASIARQNLLDRIRAARASASGTTGRLGRG